MGTLTTFGELITTAFLTFVLGAIAFIVRSQMGINRVLSDGIQFAMSEIKLIRAMADEKEEARNQRFVYHTNQIVELKKKTEQMDDDITQIDYKFSTHLISHKK